MINMKTIKKIDKIERRIDRKQKTLGMLYQVKLSKYV